MKEIPKLKSSYFGSKYVICPKCDYWADRFSTIKSTNKKIDDLEKECPYCRLKARLEELIK